MAELDLKVTVVIRTLDEERALAEALFFPEFSCFGTKLDRIEAALTRHVRQIAEAEPAGVLHRRRRAGEAEVAEVTLELAPPDREQGDPARANTDLPAEAWQQGVPLRFQAVVWKHGESAYVAFVPALGIEVVGETDQQLRKLLPEHIRFALLRSRSTRSLRELVHLQRVSDVRLKTLEVATTIKSPKRRAAEEGKEEAEKPVIETVGADLAAQSPKRAWELDAVVSQLADALVGRVPRSVLLVGKSGVGKTSAIHELVRRREALGLALTPFWATSGSRLVAGMSGFGMWQQRCQRLCREAAKAGAVLYVGNLVELTEVGKSVHNSQGIASFLRPYLARGEVLAVSECTPEQAAVIERVDPHLAEVFHRIDVEEPAPEVAKLILLNEVLAAEPRGDALSEGALETIDRLHRRYATYSAFPARPLRFVRNLLHDRRAEAEARHAAPAGTLGPPEVIAAFARETGLPRFMLDPAVPLDLAAAREWFAARVIGQGEAVELVADLLATVKAALNRPRRPIASLLFIGPTGVGKTEMAKSLAEFFFSDAARITRFDMSEYATPEAVERLVGTAGGEGLLTAKVREQPFSVVLLDEFEKADAGLFELMLQVLGEGRLTDAAGRVADFSNAIVILTSNLGAASFQQAPFGLVQGERGRNTRNHFVEEVRSFFRPELFNRIDRVVPFAPLAEEVVLQIAWRELELVRRRDGVRLRGAEVRVSEAAVRWLARRGFDARYGARPLKREIERELLVPLADSVNRYAEDAALLADVDTENETAARLRVTVRAAVGEGGRQVLAAASDATFAAPARDALSLRRDVQRLHRSAAAIALQNERYALCRLQESIRARREAAEKAKRQWPDKPIPRSLLVRPHEETRLARLTRVAPVHAAMEAVAARATALEDEALLAVYEPSPEGDAVATDLHDRLSAARQEWDRLLLSIYVLKYAGPDEALVVVYGERTETLFELADVYRGAAAARGGRVAVYQLLRPGSADPDRRLVEKPEPFFAEPPGGTAGIALLVTGANALPLFELERGVHEFVREKKTFARCLVETGGGTLANYSTRSGLPLREQIEKGVVRRSYDFDQSFVDDTTPDVCLKREGEAPAEPGLQPGEKVATSKTPRVQPPAKRRTYWTGRQWPAVVGKLIDQTLREAAQSLVDE